MISRRRGALAAAAATLASAFPARNSRADAGALAALRFRTAEGDERSLADYAGRAVVMNFWATWCVPCVAEMASLDRLAAALPQAAILALSSDRGGVAAVRRFYTEKEITRLAILLDPQGGAARGSGARGIPTTLLIDAAGEERGRVEGAADWASPESVAMIKALG